MRSFGVIILLAFTFVSMVKGDPPRTKNIAFCEKFAKEKCETSPGIRKNCPELCGDSQGLKDSDHPTEGPKGLDQHTQNPNHDQDHTHDNPNHDHSSKKPTNDHRTSNCDKRSACIPLETANGNFHKRCEATNGALKPTCYDHCRYDENTAQMKKAFLGGACPLGQLRTYLTSASKGRDNTQCCQDTGVLSAPKTTICGCFCNPTGPVWPGKGQAAKYAPCVGVLEGIMKCHQFAEGTDE